MRKLVLVIVASSCSSPTLNCKTSMCGTSSKTYQACTALDGTVTYSFTPGCSCPPGNTTQCQSCANSLASYCAGGGGTTGGTVTATTGGGGSDGGAGCMYTVSGAVSQSGSSCMFIATVAKGGGIGVVFSNTGGLNFACTLSSQTALVAGSYTLADCAPGAGAEVLDGMSAWDMCTDSQNCNDAKGHMSSPQGSFTLTVNQPGLETGGTLWQSAHGTLELILPAQPNGPAMGTATVEATF